MKHERKILLNLAILVITLCMAGVAKSAPMGTAFTYQGRLVDSNSPAEGAYDLDFALFDDPTAGSQQGSTVSKDEVDVTDGYFTVDLDFGSDIFTGDARWLEISVWPVGSGDPCDFATLSPRQEVTPTPYALHTRGLLVDEARNNVFAGEGAGVSNTTGSYNSAVGNEALFSNTTGSRNSAMGSYALYSNTTGNYNSAMGYNALKNNTIGNYNLAVGYLALFSNTTGSNNSAMGEQALRNNTTGVENSAVGNSALRYNTTGNSNSAMGYSALYSNTTGLGNSAMGFRALWRNTTGIYNSAMGGQALYSNTTGNENTALGFSANRYNQEGSQNTIIGYEAGRGTATHNKSGNVFIGYQAGYNESGDNKLYIENSNSSTPLIYGEFDNDILTVNGDVGIGTTSPNEKLTIEGALSLQEISAPSPTSGYGKLYVKSADSKPYFKDDSGTEYNLTAGTGDSDWTISGDDMYSAVTGNVGIGTTNPATKLDVVGTITVTGGTSDNWNTAYNWGDHAGAGYLTSYTETDPIFAVSTAAGIVPTDITNWNTAFGWGDHSTSGYLTSESDPQVGVNTTNYLPRWNGSALVAGTVYDNGNVGIGTTSPTTKLDVDGTVNATAFVGDGSGLTGIAADSDWTISGDDMYSTVTGNVGIGTTSPDEDLVVYDATGNSRLKMSTEDNYDALIRFDQGTTQKGAVGYDDSEDVVKLNYGTLGNNHLSVDSGGNVGIGTTNPKNRVDIEGAVAIGASYSGTNTAPNNGIIIQGRTGIGTASPSYKVHVIGDIAYTGNVYDVSDVRLKENITPLTNSVEKVSALQGIYFNNKGEPSDKREVGVIAQDVEKVLPELVSTDQDGYKSVDYTKLTVVLIEAFKKLKAENEQLRTQNDSFNQRLTSMENIITQKAVSMAREVQ